jgi:hypothetical protein
LLLPDHTHHLGPALFSFSAVATLSTYHLEPTAQLIFIGAGEISEQWQLMLSR